MQIPRAPRAATAGSRLFVSAKTVTAVPLRCPLVRDALIQASLDPMVRSIEFIASARVEQTPVDLGAIVLVRDDSRYLLDVVPARRLRDIEEEGLALIAINSLGLAPLVLTAAEIRREPRFANCTLVWGHRLHPIGISLRLQILQTLADDGPMQLSRLLPAIRSDRDPGPAVLALACAGLVELDLDSAPLGPQTVARSLA